MGRVHKPWTLSNLVQLLLEQPGRMITKSELYRIVHGSRYPEEWKALLVSVATESLNADGRFTMQMNSDTGAQEIVLMHRGY